MTLPDQPSALSKEELAGLLGQRLKHTNDVHALSADTSGAKPSEPESSRRDSAPAAGDPAALRAEASSAADGGDDLRMVLDHWERTVASLQLELIELRSRVARLEQQLGEETARPAPPPAGGPPGDAGRAVTAPKAPANDVSRAEDEPALSRVRTYRSKRGWF
ncbi:hypothetical protein [Cohnella hashimotonis]|uniref:Uncharacterized protein n=1 Tax=Cohnella hashimotonis TaxID=2826895 RepID=A0ABT6TTF8_9BACL|nr:hypothetical protein [Cohnella hashimotonis]MDI4650147.1 hypothetical protein [Cohnella hashimotonis]